jgi:hypothetical protein
MSHNLRHPSLDVTIRYAFPDDAPAIASLAALDSQTVPEGVLLVAEVDGELWAARSLTTTGAIADPFRPSADAAALLDARAVQLQRSGGPVSVFEPAAWLRAVLSGG